MTASVATVRVDPQKCRGRMKCLRACPAQAIRVRNGKARFLADRCIHCGECIPVCPNGAIVALTNPFGELTKFRYTVAIPSPALYAQFGREILPDKILNGITTIGFDDTYDQAQICGMVSFAIQEFLRDHQGPRPIISNACPVIVHLIQVKYPNLLGHILPLEVPREIAAREIKKVKARQYELPESQIGAFYLTPCPSKMVSIRQPAGQRASHLDGAIAIADVYGPLRAALESVPAESYRRSLENICILGIGWAMVGGICRTLRLRNSLAASGLPEIIRVFDDIERGKLNNIDFIEAYSCPQGCVGGSLTVENVYVSFNKILKLIETLEYEKIKACPDVREVRRLYREGYFSSGEKHEPRPIRPLDENLSRAISLRKEKDALCRTLPQIDCGACGAPTCLAFAEDVVRGECAVEQCPVLAAGRGPARSGPGDNALQGGPS
ncbi:MAG: 4Fe-4S dicluster domain-containing protein [Candidatus Aminicenantes bacterium]|nr:4Fe-4S dicluster domain-containing protein [Candidatus Aminicenantes bacterium]